MNIIDNDNETNVPGVWLVKAIAPTWMKNSTSITRNSLKIQIQSIQLGISQSIFSSARNQLLIFNVTRQGKPTCQVNNSLKQ